MVHHWFCVASLRRHCSLDNGFSQCADPQRLQEFCDQLSPQHIQAFLDRWFGRLGYAVDHLTGSHIILRNSAGPRLTIPNHRDLAKGTLRAIIREARMTKDEFAALL